MRERLHGRMRKQHTLRIQISLTFIGLLLLALLAILAVNGFFLEKYYISKKKETMVYAFDMLKEYETVTDAGSISQEWINESAKQNLTWVIISEENQEWKLVVGYGVRTDTNIMTSRLFGYTHGLEQEEKEKKRFEILEKKDDYIIQKSKESMGGVDYIEIWGVLPGGSYAMVRSPLESIRESAAISNYFYFFVGVVIILVSGICIWLITKRITRPISELTELSRKMADLDFDAKYQSETHNEIDVLGENFNKMSRELENTIMELKSANIELQKDIEIKTRMDEQRREFLGNVSHELKTPIALIQGYAEGLKENISDDVESREFYCDVIMDEASKMNKLVRSLLTLNQLESGQDAVEMERFDLVELVKGVIQKAGIMIQQKEARVFFREEAPVYVWADEFKIEEVITNYLTNALNHLGGAGEIEIKLEHTSPLRVSVFNTGNPIPEEDLPNLWNKFYKVDKAHTREYGGSGIGLSIVKAIIDSHNQKCGVTNYENGVEFWFTLDTDKR